MVDLVDFITFLIACLLAVAVGYAIVRVRSRMDSLNESYLWNGYSNGYFKVPKHQQNIILWIIVAQAFGVLWIYANVAEIRYILVATFYLFIIMLSYVIFKFEYIMPQLSDAAVVGFGDEEEIEKQILIGLLIGIVTIFMFSATTPLQTKLLTVSVISLVVTIVSVPIIEEMFFGNFLTATLVERGGIVVGVLVPAIVFAVFHKYAYDADFGAMFSVFVFRVLSGLALVKFNSFVPGLVGHIFVNAVSVLEGVR